MPLKVSFELSDRDLRYFRKKMREARAGAKAREESEIIESTASLLEEMRGKNAPDFVRERISKLEVMVEMLDDREWNLSGPDRTHVLNAMAYFAEAEDLIPDAIPAIGFLDDAIMVELVVKELENEIDAYHDFCDFRTLQEKVRGKREDEITREEWLKGKRSQLHSRMRRRRRTRRSRGRGPAGKPTPFSLW
ncbi:DUF1232 domain-containing protein [Myxococcota bacterium]|nr:DUF1232 domain-containing protein [Myxococcota bacterium]